MQSFLGPIYICVHKQHFSSSEMPLNYKLVKI